MNPYRCTPILTALLIAVLLLGSTPAFAQPDIVASPSPLDIGDLLAINGSTGYNYNITLTNEGDADLTITSAASSDEDLVQPPFDPVFPVTLGPGEFVETEFLVSTAAPANYFGPVSETLTFMSNDPDDPALAVAVNYTILTPIEVTTPSVLDFGNVGVGDTACRTVMVANEGNLTLSVDLTGSIFDPNFALGPTQLESFSVAAGDAEPVEICFSPTSPGTKSDFLDGSTNDYRGGLVVGLSGVGGRAILSCDGVGTGGDLADTRGIVFNVEESFEAIELRLAGREAGAFTFDAELRRSSGFTSPVEATVSVSVFLRNDDSVPFRVVLLDFGTIPVSGPETFSLRFTNVTGPDDLFFETFGIDNVPCPNVMETDENDVAMPTERGDPAGFAVLTPTLLPDETPPVCGAIVPEFNGPNGAFSAVQTSASDGESGIASITFTSLVNLNGFADANGDGVFAGPFAQGALLITLDPNPTTVDIRGERIDFATGGRIVVTVTNGEGLTANCDPVVNRLDAGIPKAFALDAAYPNPFVGLTAIPFALPHAEHVRIVVYDVTGREVAVLADEPMEAGHYEVAWSPTALPSGMYVVRLRAGDRHATQRLTLLR